MRCSNCAIWELLESDIFCSWCGQEVFQIVVRAAPIRVYLEPDENVRVVPINILQNKSPKPITLQCVKAPAWLKVEPARAVEVKPSGKLSVNLSILPDKLTGVPRQNDEIVFRSLSAATENNGSFKEATIGIQLWPLPGLIVKPLTIFTTQPRAEAALNIEAQAEVQITKIVFDPPLLKLDSAKLSELKLGDSAVPVQMNLPAPVNPKTYSINYEITGEGIEKTFTGQFKLAVMRPAILNTDAKEESFEKYILPGIEDEIIFKVSNEGDQELIIEGVHIHPLGTDPRISLMAGPFPSSIEPGKQAPIRFSVMAGPLAQTARHHWFEINFECNDPNPDNRILKLWVEVVDEIYPDFIAVDFGTTDSAVAYFGDNKVPANLNLDRKSPGEPKIYSNIFFKNLIEDAPIPYEWCIGTEAKLYGPPNRQRFVKGIKTKAGLNHSEEIDFEKIGRSCSVPAEDIIKFIMMDLLQFTNISLGKKPVKLVLSVPTRFSIRQKEILKFAIKEAASARSLVLEKVEIIDESLAAGLFFILVNGPRNETIKKKDTYTLMILDFGGGTTDVTVFRIRQHPEPNGRLSIDEVEVIGAWGDATLGGEEITTEIASLLASGFLGQEFDPKVNLKHVRKLEDEAEAVKLVISELQRIEADKLPNAATVLDTAGELLARNLAYISRNRSGDSDLIEYLGRYFANGNELDVYSDDFRDSEPVKITEKQVVDIFNRRLHGLKAELKTILSRILNLATGSEIATADPQVDILLLAGQSAQFPTVTNIFRELSKHDIDFVRDAKGQLLLKECVSRGALYYSFHLNQTLKFMISGQDRQWTRLGKMTFIPGEGARFEELIPWSTKYPFVLPEFMLTRAADVNSQNELVLEILENLSMQDDDERRNTRPFSVYRLPLENSTADDYRCRLEVTRDGNVKVSCKVRNKWISMEPTR